MTLAEMEARFKSLKTPPTEEDRRLWELCRDTLELFRKIQEEIERSSGE